MLSNSLFWEFSHPQDRKAASAIVGTIHMAIPQTDPIFQRICQWIDRYDRVFTEAPLHDYTREYLSKNILVDPFLWKKYWTRHKKERIRKSILKSFKVDIDYHLSIRPMFILTLIYGQIMPEAGSMSLDHKIWTYSQQKGKKIDGLETVEEQVRIMQKLPLDTEYRQLWHLSRNTKKVRKKFYILLETYCDEDIGGLLKKTRSSLGTNKRILLHERNERMVERMIKVHHETPSLFSFGAAHLAGNKGVLALLKRHGYIVKAMARPQIT